MSVHLPVAKMWHAAVGSSNRCKSCCKGQAAGGLPAWVKQIHMGWAWCSTIAGLRTAPATPAFCTSSIASGSSGCLASFAPSVGGGGRPSSSVWHISTGLRLAVTAGDETSIAANAASYLCCPSEPFAWHHSGAIFGTQGENLLFEATQRRGPITLVWGAV